MTTGVVDGAGTTLSSRGTRPAGPSLRTRERRPGYIALLVALIVGLAAVAAMLYSKAGAKTPVVVVTRAVPAGHTVQREDLSTIAVGVDLDAIPARELSTAVGRTATVALLPHMLLQSAMLSTAGPLSAGQALVGVAVDAGQLPGDGLNPGDTVRVIQLPAKGAAPAGTGEDTVLAATARVFSAHANTQSAGGTVVSLIVTQAQADAVAAASASGLVALILVPAP